MPKSDIRSEIDIRIITATELREGLSGILDQIKERAFLNDLERTMISQSNAHYMDLIVTPGQAPEYRRLSNNAHDKQIVAAVRLHSTIICSKGILHHFPTENMTCPLCETNIDCVTSCGSVDYHQL